MILANIKSIFPFQLFRDELIIEEEKIIWKRRLGFMATQMVTFLPEEITKVECDVGPLFGHLHIDTFGRGGDILMEDISRKNAILGRNLVEGLVECCKHNIKLKGKTRREKIRELIALAGVKI